LVTADSVYWPETKLDTNPQINDLSFDLSSEMRANNSLFSVFRYSRTHNLGDAIQTVALSRLLPGRLQGVNRVTANGALNTCLVANGWLGDNFPPKPNSKRRCVFAGIFIAQEHNLQWLSSSTSPIGARDPYTHKRLSELGIHSELIGCATLTLPRFQGRRARTYVVDSDYPLKRDCPFVRLTHHISGRMSWRDQWVRALEFLDYYRRAALVITSRLHVALPCIAFGTPVIFTCPDPTLINDPLVYRRMTLLDYLGVCEGVATVTSPNTLDTRYRKFLEYTLGIGIREHNPSFPL
jgi:hypothetical protein